jgi:hypothetical protein
MTPRTASSKPAPALWALGVLLISCVFSVGAVALLLHDAWVS